jgi:uncharacterized protein
VWRRFNLFFRKGLMNELEVIEKSKDFLQEYFKKFWPSHDFWHIMRVYNNAIKIREQEECDTFVVKLWALFHDVWDWKYEDWWNNIIKDFLDSLKIENDIISHVINIVENISYSSSLDWDNFTSKELFIVRDADRLDAIWAVWIARCMCYSWEKWREIYNPNIEVKLNMTKDEYKNHKSTAINHFYEKLLNLKWLMHTKTWLLMAEERHNFMNVYLEHFFDEIK